MAEAKAKPVRQGRKGSRKYPNGSPRKGGEIVTRVGGRAAAVVLNPQSIKDWDIEELERGYQRDRNGNFTGRPPKLIPQVIIDELHRRKFVDAIGLFKESLPEAIAVLRGIMNSALAKDSDRIKAAEIIIERILPARIDLGFNSKEPKFIAALMAAIVPGDEADEETDNDVIDVEAR